MNNLILKFVIFLLVYFLLDAWHDTYVLKWASEKNTKLKSKYKSQWHTIDTLIKGFVLFALLYSTYGFSFMTTKLLLLGVAVRWIWFDLWISILWAKSFIYLGTSANSDKIFDHFWVQMLFKFLYLTVTILFLVLDKDHAVIQRLASYNGLITLLIIIYAVVMAWKFRTGEWIWNILLNKIN